MKLLVSDLAAGAERVGWPWARTLSAGLVMGANNGKCSPADLAHGHVPRAESRDVLLAWL